LGLYREITFGASELDDETSEAVETLSASTTCFLAFFTCFLFYTAAAAKNLIAPELNIII